MSESQDTDMCDKCGWDFPVDELIECPKCVGQFCSWCVGEYGLCYVCEEFFWVEEDEESMKMYDVNQIVHEKDGKWFFWDECWVDEYGPFDTRTIAEAERQKYFQANEL